MSQANHGTLPVARTDEGKAFEKLYKELRGIAHSGDEEALADWKEANEEVLNLKLSPSNVFHSDILTTMSVMFKNDELIWDRVMPMVTTNGQKGGEYWEYDRRDQLAFPDDAVSSEGEVNELGANRTKGNYQLTERSLKERVALSVIKDQSAPLNELMDAQMHVLQGVEMNRELRVATKVGTSTAYGSNTVAIAAADRWDTATGGNPGQVVDTARAAVWEGMGPGRWVLATSLSVHNVLKRHPLILDTFKYGGNAPAFATRQMLAEYFEVDEYVVGKARKDTANINQTASYSRIWPDVLALVRVAGAPSLRNAAFGYVLQDAATRQTMWFDNREGSEGMYTTRATRYDQEKVIAATCGYLITTPIG